jgi:hypothetical protein
MSDNKILVIDPPSGWKYGFPKPIPEPVLRDLSEMRKWLVQQGYPAKDVELAIKYSRYWETKDV